ncbi:MAG: arabinosyltransferase domain-containing protein, partial [Actinomycetota bacterium]|nr:arabinosyltransferase domain-containing protein [Actinomycetota bacterium]
ATVPPDPDPAAESLPGLRAAVVDGALRVVTGGVPLDPVPLPAGDCTVTLTSDPQRTTVAVDGRPVVVHEGDARPAVVGVFTDAPATDGLSVRFTADTRFQTTIGPLKAGIAVLGALAVLGMLVLLARREAPARVRLLPRGWWRPRGPDLFVTATMAGWWVIGPVTVDDGYIAGIVRSRGENGFIGNVYRWLNAPEAPFSWFYDLYALWSGVSASTAWLRLPSVLLALATWFLVSRAVAPRLLPARSPVTNRWTPWLVAVATLAWFVPFLPSMRPEPWVALGLVGTVLAVERGIATRRLTPLVVGLLVGGVTTAVTPGGLMAFVPFLAAGVPVLRTLRARAVLFGRWPLIAVLLAAPAAAVFLMASDQSLAAMLEATRVRALIGGGQPWYEEYTRYSDLLEPGDIYGTLGRRLPVLLTLLAAGGTLWVLARRGSGLPAGPGRRVVVSFLLALVAMTATPTKWSQHFGDVAGLGGVVLALGLVAGSAAVLRRRTTSPAPALLGLTVVVVTGSLVLAGWNNWPFVSNWWEPTWSTVSPPIAGVPAATVWLVAGLAVVGFLAVRLGWRASADRPLQAPRRQPSPAAPALLLTVLVLAVTVLSFARTAVTHRDDYTLASDAVSTAAGRPCGLQERVSVETDPAAGLLPVDGPAEGTAPLPVDVGGTAMPGIAATAPARTGWFRLDPQQTAQALPVVVTVSGTLPEGRRLVAEFSDAARSPVAERDVRPSDEEPGTPTDRRLLAPDGARYVRLVVDDAPRNARAGATGGGAVVSLPRVPRLTRMTDLLPPGTPAVLDWPVAFVFGCLTPAPLPQGTASVPRWRVGTEQSSDAGEITYAPGFGGPFAGPRLLVTQRRMATYLDGDPTRDATQLYRWTPRPATPLAPQVTPETVPGWSGDGRATVPGLDPVS